jgi:hypothetical protein
LAWRRVLELRSKYPGNRVLRRSFHRTRPILDDTAHFCATSPADVSALDSWALIAADQHGYLEQRVPLSIRSLSYRRTAAGRAELSYRRLPAQEKQESHEADAEIEAQTNEPLQQAVPARSRADLQSKHREALANRDRERRRLDELDQVFDCSSEGLPRWNRYWEGSPNRPGTPEAARSAK